MALGIFVIVGVGVLLFATLSKFMERDRKRRRTNVPAVTEGGSWLFGHALDLLRVPPWDQMAAWSKKYGSMVQFRLFDKNLVVVSEPAILRQILQTKIGKFRKDVEFTYK